MCGGLGVQLALEIATLRCVLGSHELAAEQILSDMGLPLAPNARSRFAHEDAESTRIAKGQSDTGVKRRRDLRKKCPKDKLHVSREVYIASGGRFRELHSSVKPCRELGALQDKLAAAQAKLILPSADDQIGQKPKRSEEQGGARLPARRSTLDGLGRGKGKTKQPAAGQAVAASETVTASQRS
jgi:hypothetical protein